jgi:hypothetical protein
MNAVEVGHVTDKDAIRDILVALVEGTPRWFSPGRLGIEQATNRIGALQRPPSNWVEVALTVHCPYCGRTAGNSCAWAGANVKPHPSRFNAALSGGAS